MPLIRLDESNLQRKEEPRRLWDSKAVEEGLCWSGNTGHSGFDKTHESNKSWDGILLDINILSDGFFPCDEESIWFISKTKDFPGSERSS